MRSLLLDVCLEARSAFKTTLDISALRDVCPEQLLFLKPPPNQPLLHQRERETGADHSASWQKTCYGLEGSPVLGLFWKSKCLHYPGLEAAGSGKRKAFWRPGITWPPLQSALLQLVCCFTPLGPLECSM